MLTRKRPGPGQLILLYGRRRVGKTALLRHWLSYQPDRVLPLIQQGLRAFVGQTAWKELARQWVWRRGMERSLPFVPEVIGSHWSRHVQTDVVAINWPARAILIGECKWGSDIDFVTEESEQHATISAMILEVGALKPLGWPAHAISRCCATQPLSLHGAPESSAPLQRCQRQSAPQSAG